MTEVENCSRRGFELFQSCLYRGIVRHSRPEPAHHFEYTTAWGYVDLDELDSLWERLRLLGSSRFSPIAFRRQDHFGDPDVSLRDAVNSLIWEQTGLSLSGPVRVLTQFRHFGVYFSPINVFYCYDDNEALVAMVAEVSNTPWNERHCYVLWEGIRREGSGNRYSHPKSFHVSPFMGMDTQYEWRIQPPGDDLRLSLGCEREGKRIFQADLSLSRLPLTDTALLKTSLRRPVAGVHIIGAIYYQALRLWMKKCPFFPHPKTLQGSGASQPIHPNPTSKHPRHLEHT